MSGGRGRLGGVSSGRARPGGVSSGRPRAEEGRVRFIGMYRGRATSNPALDKRKKHQAISPGDNLQLRKG